MLLMGLLSSERASFCLNIAKTQIEIRLIAKPLQLTIFQLFQRTILNFNGTAMK